MSQDKKENTKKTPIAFYFIQWLLPVILLGLVEVGLRLFGYGTNYELFIKIEGNNPEVLYVNPVMTNKYFGNLENSVFSSRIGFLEKKETNSFRVFVLGGSSTQGFPYAQNASFPSHLKRRLDHLYPKQTIEVINLGASAINTHTLLDILPQVLEQSPDLILIYAGHNEYYGALGPGSSQFSHPSLTRIYLALKDFRLVQFFENLLRSTPEQGENGNENLMQDMIGESAIEMNSSTYQAGIDQFESNISRILDKIGSADVPVIIGTLSSNLHTQKPFISSQKDEENFDANTLYKMGLESIENQEYTEAKNLLVRAKELDGLRFRAPEKINEIIREKASELNVPLVDINKIFSDHSPMNITGDDLMCDHLHPNRRGYFLMSKSFFQIMEENDLLPNNNYVYETEVIDSLMLKNFPYSRLDSLVDRRLLLSGLGSYPFVPKGAPNPYMDIINNDGLEFEINSLSQIDSIRKIVATKHLLDGDTSAFIKEMSVFLSYFPVDEKSYANAINYLSQNSILSTAYPLLYEELKKLKISNSKLKMMGRYFNYSENYDSALFYLQKVEKNTPKDPYLLLDLGYTHLAMRNLSKSLDSFSSVIELLPDNMEAYHQRAVTHFELKNYENVVSDMSQAIELSTAPSALQFLIRGYAKLGLNQTTEACVDWKTAESFGSSESSDLLSKFCR